MRMTKHFASDSFFFDDFFNFFCGKLLGAGTDRRVYEFKHDETLVVKIDVGGKFANVEEWRVWNNIKDNLDIAKYMAPCVRISNCGRVMLQVKTQPLESHVDLMIPDFMWDIKKENWGMLNGQVICHDYANNIFHRKVETKLVKAEWY